MDVKPGGLDHRSLHAPIYHSNIRSEPFTTILQNLEHNLCGFEVESNGRLCPHEEAARLENPDLNRAIHYTCTSLREHSTTASRQALCRDDFHLRITKLETRIGSLEEDFRRISNQLDTNDRKLASPTNCPIVKTTKREVITSSHRRRHRGHSQAEADPQQRDDGDCAGLGRTHIPSTDAKVASKGRPGTCRDDLTIDGNPRLTGSGSTNSLRLVKTDDRWVRENEGKNGVRRVDDGEAAIPRARSASKHGKRIGTRSKKTVSFEPPPKPGYSRSSKR